jgi:hypothetical protein
VSDSDARCDPLRAGTVITDGSLADVFALAPEYMNISGSFSVDGAVRIGSALSESKQANTTLVPARPFASCAAAGAAWPGTGALGPLSYPAIRAMRLGV